MAGGWWRYAIWGLVCCLTLRDKGSHLPYPAIAICWEVIVIWPYPCAFTGLLPALWEPEGKTLNGNCWSLTQVFWIPSACWEVIWCCWLLCCSSSACCLLWSHSPWPAMPPRVHGERLMRYLGWASPAASVHIWGCRQGPAGSWDQSWPEASWQSSHLCSENLLSPIPGSSCAITSVLDCGSVSLLLAVNWNVL